MRINEVIVEAISLTKYESTVEEAIRDGILQSMTALANLKGINAQEEKQAIGGDIHPLIREIFPKLVEILKGKLPNLLRVKISRNLDKDTNLTVRFESIPRGVNAYVDKTEMVISDRYISVLTKIMLSNISRSVVDLYDSNKVVDGLFFTFKMIGSKDKQSVDVATNGIENIINSFVDTVVHELVHVIQHQKQFQKGRDDTEYRSYLDKTKDEFLNLPSHRTDDEYYRLYYASPQEISAISHQMTLGAIRKFNLRNIKSEEDIPNITSEDISEFIKKWIDDRFRNPENQKEYSIFKRYAKLVYQEIQRFIDEKRKTFKPSEV